MRRSIRRVIAVLLAAPILVGATTELGRYMARAAFEEGKILWGRRDLVAMVTDTATPPALAGRLGLVLDVRRFAGDRLGFKTGASFTTFSQLERDTLVLVLSASRRDTLAARTWWFPVVGRFPYKGYFDFEEARRQAAALQREGFDTYLRPASAFSTLGWFNDPLVSTTVGQDSAGLANTVIHELLHSTLFVKGHVVFNESFASFVGARGAVELFEARGDSALARRAALDWEDDKLLGQFWEATARRIDSVFAIPGRTSAARIAARDTVYAQMRKVLTRDIAPRLRTLDPVRMARVQLDNAALLARRTYASDLYVFDEVHRRAGGRLRNTVAVVGEVVRGTPDPYVALRKWLARPQDARR